MKESKINQRGIIPPIITCFDEDGNFYEEGQRRLVSFLNDYVHGYWVCGSYGSFPLLSVEERKRVLEVIMDEVNEEKHVIANVGSPTPKVSVELGKHAKEVGADAIGSVPPYYHRHREKDIKYYFEILKGEVDHALYFYNNPKTTGYTLSPEFLNDLIADDLLDGLKDSAFDMLLFYDFMRKSRDLREEKGKDFDFIIGTEALMVPALINGASGSIAGIANCIPEDTVKCYDAVMDGDIEKAVEIQDRVLKERDISHLAPSGPAVQAILKIRGLDAGVPQAPFQEPEEEVIEEMKVRLKDLGIGEI